MGSAGAVWLILAAALAAPNPTFAASPSLRVGDSVTQSIVLGYLASPPKAGDWVRYRMRFGTTIIDKTVGFGSEEIDGHVRPFVELLSNAGGIANPPVPAASPMGGTSVAKTYLGVETLGPIDQSYPVLATVLQIGDALYRVDYRKSQPPEILANAPAPRFSILEAFVPDDPKRGLVIELLPQDVRLKETSIHATRVTARFGATLAGAVPEVQFSAWQSSEVPLGTVAIRAQVGTQAFQLDLVDFGRGSYVPRIKEKLADIPPLPGSR